MKVEIIKELNTEEYSWCSSAVLIELSDGKGVLTSIKTDYDEDYCQKSTLILNGKPLIQGEYPICPTCSAMIARGYGIEKIDTPKLQKIRDKVNSPFVSLRTAIENIKSIIGLLDDGYYIIADAMLYPTDGENHFFMNVPDKAYYMDAATPEYYNSDFMTVADGFPAYIYPTQSNSCLNIDRAKYYLDMIEKENAPRAIAYYQYGFLCALLDGHHKAYAAALKGAMLHSIVIIPIQYVLNDMNKKEVFAVFGDMKINMKELPNFKPDYKKTIKNITFEEYHNPPVNEDGMFLECYPTVEELSGYLVAKKDNTELTKSIIDDWLSKNDIDMNRLKYYISYYARTDLKKSMMIVKEILTNKSSSHFLKEFAVRFLVGHKSDEAEQMIIDYLIEHDATDICWKIANGYWHES